MIVFNSILLCLYCLKTIHKSIYKSIHSYQSINQWSTRFHPRPKSISFSGSQTDPETKMKNSSVRLRKVLTTCPTWTLVSFSTWPKRNKTHQTKVSLFLTERIHQPLRTHPKCYPNQGANDIDKEVPSTLRQVNRKNQILIKTLCFFDLFFQQVKRKRRPWSRHQGWFERPWVQKEDLDFL